MNNFMNKLYVKALVTANMAKNELKKMCEEDEGMDIIVTIVLVALGIVIVGVVARIASDVIGKADQQVSGLDSTFAQLKYVRSGSCLAGQDSFPAGCTALEERYSLKETRKRGRIDAKIIKGSFKSGNFTLEYGHRPERKMAQGCTR